MDLRETYNLEGSAHKLDMQEIVGFLSTEPWPSKLNWF